MGNQCEVIYNESPKDMESHLQDDILPIILINPAENKTSLFEPGNVDKNINNLWESLGPSLDILADTFGLPREKPDSMTDLDYFKILAGELHKNNDTSRINSELRKWSAWPTVAIRTGVVNCSLGSQIVVRILQKSGYSVEFGMPESHAVAVVKSEGKVYCVDTGDGLVKEVEEVNPPEGFEEVKYYKVVGDEVMIGPQVHYDYFFALPGKFSALSTIKNLDALRSNFIRPNHSEVVDSIVRGIPEHADFINRDYYSWVKESLFPDIEKVDNFYSIGGATIGNNSGDTSGENDLDGKDAPKWQINYGGMSQEEHRRALDKFNEEVEEAYDAIVNPLVEYIISHAREPKDRLKMLFDYLTSDNKVYDMGFITSHSEMVGAKTYSLPGHESEGFKYDQTTKYPAVLNDAGVCTTYSVAFKDIADRLNIPCIVVNGRTSMGHAWNAVYLDGEVRFIDVAYAIMHRGFQDKNNYFLTSMGGLERSGGARTIGESSREELAKFEREELEKFNLTKITILNRTDIPPKIKIHNIPPKISIKHRGDKPSIDARDISDRV